MSAQQGGRRLGTVIAGCLSSLLASAAAHASYISATPTLPPLGVPFVSVGGVGCFPAAGVCVQPGSLTFTSVISASFDASGQNILANATYDGTLTNLSHVPIGPITLTGTVEEEVLGRTFSTQTGSWNTELLSLALSGPVLGHTLTLGLGVPPSTGMASIQPVGVNQGEAFRIDSFFDIFVDLTLDSTPPLHTTRGPLHAELVAAPEPASLVLLVGGVLGLAAARRSR